MKTCNTCDYWDEDYTCNRATLGDSKDKKILFQVESSIKHPVSDEKYLVARLVTNRKFGCILHKQQINEN